MMKPLLAALGSGALLFACAEAPNQADAPSSGTARVGEPRTETAKQPLGNTPAPAPQRACRLAGELRLLHSNTSVLGPSLSPDARWVVFSGPKFAQVSLLDISTRSLQELVSQEGVGWRVRWNTPLAFTLQAPSGVGFSVVAPDHFLQPLHDAQRPTRTPVSPLTGHAYYQQDDRIWASQDASTPPIPISPDSHRAFNPQLSPDGTLLLWEELSTGLYLRHLDTGRDVAVGPGNHASFSADSSRLFFDRSTDDGTRIVTSDLWVFDLPSASSQPLTTTPDRLEMYPSAAANLASMAYADGNSLFLAQLTCDD